MKKFVIFFILIINCNFLFAISKSELSQEYINYAIRQIKNEGGYFSVSQTYTQISIAITLIEIKNELIKLNNTLKEK